MKQTVTVMMNDAVKHALYAIVEQRSDICVSSPFLSDVVGPVHYKWDCHWPPRSSEQESNQEMVPNLHQRSTLKIFQSHIKYSYRAKGDKILTVQPALCCSDLSGRDSSWPRELHISVSLLG